MPILLRIKKESGEESGVENRCKPAFGDVNKRRCIHTSDSIQSTIVRFGFDKIFESFGSGSMKKKIKSSVLPQKPGFFNITNSSPYVCNPKIGLQQLSTIPCHLPSPLCFSVRITPLVIYYLLHIPRSWFSHFYFL